MIWFGEHSYIGLELFNKVISVPVDCRKLYVYRNTLHNTNQYHFFLLLQRCIINKTFVMTNLHIAHVCFLYLYNNYKVTI